MHDIFIDTTVNKTVTKRILLARGLPDNEDVLKNIGIYPVIYNYPEYDKYTEFLVANGEPNKFNDAYYQDFLVEPLEEKYLQENLAKLAEEKRTEALKMADNVVEDYMNLFSDVEKTTWYKQESEIVAYNLDNSAPTPMLDALANARGISRESMLVKTNAKVEMFKNMAVAIIGKQQSYEDTIKNIVSSDEKSTFDKIQELKNLVISYEI